MSPRFRAADYRQRLIDLRTASPPKRAELEAWIWEHLCFAAAKYMSARYPELPLGFDAMDPLQRMFRGVTEVYDPERRNAQGRLTSPWSYACRVWQRCLYDAHLYGPQELYPGEIEEPSYDPTPPSELAEQATLIQRAIREAAASESLAVLHAALEAAETGEPPEDPVVIRVLRDAAALYQSGMPFGRSLAPLDGEHDAEIENESESEPSSWDPWGICGDPEDD